MVELHPFLILAAGFVTVVGGIVLFRLHAVVALLLAGTIVAWLTPNAQLDRLAYADGYGIVAENSSRSRCEVLANTGTFAGLGKVDPGSLLVAYRRANADPNFGDPVANLYVESASADGRRLACKVVTPGVTLPAPLPPGTIVLQRPQAGERLAQAFGQTAAGVGLLIALASIIGGCLLESGAAERIVRASLWLVGEKLAPLAFVGSGFVLAVPVYFDTVFYLMMPLGKALFLRTGRNYLLYVLSIVAGATMAHSLVPPTPGPLFVAAALGVEIGLMIGMGILVGCFTAGFGLIYATVLNRFCTVPLRETGEASLAQLEELSKRETAELPPLWASLLPILLPVGLIGAESILPRLMPTEGSVSDPVYWAVGGLVEFTDKNVALGLGAAVALVLLAWRRRGETGALVKTMQNAIASAGVIVLITAAGGAFGKMLNQTGLAGEIERLSSALPALPLAFFLAALIRTAQGSATVAMITSVGIVAGLAKDPATLGFHPVYLALAIGCGSKPLAWMNDSGFWVISKMSGMTEAETLKYLTPMTGVMGLVGLLVVMVLAALFPMV